ncbi:relaxin-3 receptor 1 [Alligator mississippiensis]|nr:relaxin-3 receptor 1 [Alligator mississippiensis]
MAAGCELGLCSLAGGVTGAAEGGWAGGNRSNESLEAEAGAGLQGGGSAAVRLAVSAVYSVVCALGLVGNALVLHLMRGKRGWRKSSMNLFVTSLAATDLQFVLTLPFWAVENALDFTWLFGRVMCKVVSYVTAMNMYASVFFLTAMSVARYRTVASVLKSQPRGGCGCGCGARGLCALIWALAVVAALPHAIFSTTANVFGEELCLLRFPDSPSARVQLWLGLYQVQKVLLGFVVPLGVISLCYARLVRFLRGRHASQRRSAKVTRSVSVVVLSFFVCWLPNQALTAWGVLVKLNAVPFGPAYFLSQAYLFPVSVCLAHCNSCLNPVLYCLMRREFRQALKSLLWRLASPSLTSMRPFTLSTKPEPDEQALPALVPLPAAAPLPATTPSELLYYPPGVVVYSGRCDLLPAGPSEQRC